MSLKNTITSEEDLVVKLGSINNSTPADLSLLPEETKTKIEEAETAFNAALQVAPIEFESETAKEEVFNKLYELKTEYRKAVKNAECKVQFLKLELDTIVKLMENSVEYTSETIFYGLHLKNNFLKTLPKTRDNEFNSYTIDINFTHATVLFHLLSSVTVKGLNKANYAYASVLYTLAEVAKVSEHYNVSLSKVEQAFHNWFGGVPTETVTETKEVPVVSIAPVEPSETEEVVVIDEPTVEVEDVLVETSEQEETVEVETETVPKKKGRKK